MSRPLWGHPVGYDDPACRRRFPPWRAGEPPTKVGGLRGDILFESKEYPLALPKKDCQGGISNFPPDDPLETTKGRAAALPLETIPGSRGIPVRRTFGRGTEDGGFDACCHSGHFGLRETRLTMAR